jgi:hypothetical protein
MRGPNPGQNQDSFDNMGRAMMTWGKILTIEGWVDIQFALWHTFGLPVLVAFIFAIALLFGRYFLLELITASVCDAHNSIMEEEEEEDEEEEASIGGAGNVRGVQKDSSDSAAVVAVAQADGRAPASSSKAVAPASLAARAGAALTLPAALRAPFLAFTSAPLFETVVMSAVIANAITLAMGYYGQPVAYGVALERADIAFMFIFVAELVLKLIALGPMAYFAGGFDHYLDAFIVAVSLLQYIISAATNVSGAFSDATQALRAMRALRVLKLARHYEPLRVLVMSFLAALPPAAGGSVLVAAFVLATALTGMANFGDKYDAAVLAGTIAAVPASNFKTLW